MSELRNDPVVDWPIALRAALAEPFGTVPAMMALHARERASHSALVLDDGTPDGEVLDYAALNALIDRVAAALQRDGLKPSDSVAMCAATSLAYVASYLGAVRAGVTVAPLPPSATADQVLAMATNAGARLLFADAEVAGRWPGAEDAMPRVLLDDSNAGDTAWTAWLANAPAPRSVPRTPDDAFNIIYSSGTTGMPKGIVQSCGMRWAQLQRAPAGDFEPEAVTLLAIPLYSNLTLTYLFSALGLGGTVVLMPKFDAGRYLKLAARYRATHSMLVPVQFRRLMDHADFDRTDLSSLTHKFSAGAPFAADLKAEVMRRWTGELTEYYGMTEGGGRTELQVNHYPDKLHTIGRPSPGSDIRLIDEEGRELPPHETGELVGHSATMMSGYHGLPEQSRAAEWFDASGKRYIRTGDVGRFDSDGFIVLMDRRKDMVISGGFNLYPSDLEMVLRQHAAVADVAVVGVPSARWGETPVAFVVPRGDIAELALRKWANERLGKSQRLADLIFITQLPRSDIGKVLKRQLRDSFDRIVP